VHVDRRAELALMGQLATELSNTAKIAVVCGDAAIGKSHLLKVVRRQHESLAITYLDLRQISEPYELLDSIVTRLPDVAFPRYQRLRATFPSEPPTIVLQDTNVSGASVVNATNDGSATRRSMANQLIGPLLEDLQRAPDPRAVILLDSYERCAAEVQRWLDLILFPTVARQPDIAVVVASQVNPRAGGRLFTWCEDLPTELLFHVVELRPFEIDDVLEWMGALRLSQSRDIADFVVRSHHGMPGPIGAQLSAYAVNGGASA
jgi:hypothetical protein